MGNEREVELVKRHVGQLAEHFDSVHIFVTRHDPARAGGTVNIQLGEGNWFARYGQIQRWLTMQAESARIDQRREEDE